MDRNLIRETRNFARYIFFWRIEIIGKCLFSSVHFYFSFNFMKLKKIKVKLKPEKLNLK